MKNQKFGSWAYLVVAVLTVVCLVMYIMNVNTPYYGDMDVSVVVMLVVALAAIAATIVLPQNTPVNKIIVDLCRVAATALIIYAAVLSSACVWSPSATSTVPTWSWATSRHLMPADRQSR